VAEYELGKAELLQEGEGETLLIGYGNGVGRAIETAKLLDEKPAILDLRFVKPLDETMLRELAERYKKWYVLSDSAAKGGVGSAILEFLSEAGIDDVALTSFEYEDRFIPHGNTRLVEESLGLLPEQLAEKIQLGMRN